MDIHYLLCYLELVERSQSQSHSEVCHIASVMRDTQCSLFESELNFLEDKLNSVNTSANTSSRNTYYLSSGEYHDVCGILLPVRANGMYSIFTVK